MLQDLLLVCVNFLLKQNNFLNLTQGTINVFEGSEGLIRFPPWLEGVMESKRVRTEMYSPGFRVVW